MKHIAIVIAFLFCSIAANAQATACTLPPYRGINTELMRSIFATIVLLVLSAFVFTVLRMIPDHRLKNKMLEKGVPGEVIANMLPPKNELTIAIKWFSILIAIAAGLLFISFTLPVGIHSVVIMITCIALVFLGFYWWVKRGKGSSN